MSQFDTPILYLMFNRPDLVKQTFPRIKAVKPTHLFIGADGPRLGNENDAMKCKECRDWLLSQIDWDCEVQTLFRDENLGCGLAVSGSITWFFENVEMGIILEDDIQVNSGFFSFMETGLEIYKDDEKVAGISGFTYPNQGGLEPTYFLPIGCSWGWASYSRVWRNYQRDTKFLIKEIVNKDLILDFNFGGYAFFQMLINQLERKIDSWDIRFYASFFLNEQYFLFPAKSMVKNVGFNDSGTHSSKHDSYFNTSSGRNPILPTRIPIVLNEESAGSVKKGFENNLTSNATPKSSLLGWVKGFFK